VRSLFLVLSLLFAFPLEVARYRLAEVVDRECFASCQLEASTRPVDSRDLLGGIQRYRVIHQSREVESRQLCREFVRRSAVSERVRFSDPADYARGVFTLL